MTQQKAEIKHTPGPWRVSWHARPNHLPILADVPNLTEIAVCPAYDATDEANARLIAAAPDLLAALQAFYKWWGSIDCICLNPEPIPNALGEQMEAAIAKATNPKP